MTKDVLYDIISQYSPKNIPREYLISCLLIDFNDEYHEISIDDGLILLYTKNINEMGFKVISFIIDYEKYKQDLMEKTNRVLSSLHKKIDT